MEEGGETAAARLAYIRMWGVAPTHSQHNEEDAMGCLGFLMWILIGGLAGWAASVVMGTDDRQGCLTNILLGIVGGIVGGFLLRLAGFHTRPGIFASFLTAFIGAVLLLAIFRRR
ncbi:hypothetical protein ARMA_3130 [Ardenticatena maritima]|uniref:Transglycosylase n=2 Tax=Ardenticatena maritima TaxID=872965 RepID=A0A0M9UE64_9CHLR|nr:hypothetical protein ARMA_3130 [Ardenticatena maritima]